MKLPFKLLSTDFDGTLHADFEVPPIAVDLQRLIADFQSQGGIWVINTGRDLSSLMETLGRAHVAIWPDYVVTVEREIYRHEQSQYIGLHDWNEGCARAHEEIFKQVRLDVPRLAEWVNSRFQATVYEDPFSPFCLIAQHNGDADVVHEYLAVYCQTIPGLTVVRNDIYIRFSHIDYNKGTALSEIGRRLGIRPEHIVAAGDHLNDLPMLSTKHARWLIAPSNAIPCVKEVVLRQTGHVSHLPQSYGIAEGLQRILAEAAVPGELN